MIDAGRFARVHPAARFSVRQRWAVALGLAGVEVLAVAVWFVRAAAEDADGSPGWALALLYVAAAILTGFIAGAWRGVCALLAVVAVLTLVAWPFTPRTCPLIIDAVPTQTAPDTSAHRAAIVGAPVVAALLGEDDNVARCDMLDNGPTRANTIGWSVALGALPALIVTALAGLLSDLTRLVDRARARQRR